MNNAQLKGFRMMNEAMKAPEKKEIRKVKHSMTVQIKGKKSFSRCTFGSVAGCAVDNSENVEKALARSRKNAKENPGAGHVEHWLNADAMVLTSEGKKPAPAPMVEYGDLVSFEGRLFEITKRSERSFSGDHPGLKEIAFDTVLCSNCQEWKNPCRTILGPDDTCGRFRAVDYGKILPDDMYTGKQISFYLDEGTLESDLIHGEILGYKEGQGSSGCGMLEVVWENGDKCEIDLASPYIKEIEGFEN